MTTASAPQLRPLLLVEDDDLAARALARLLRNRRPLYTADTVAAGRELAESDLDFAGVILDHQLPDGTGLEVLDAIRAKDPLIPAALLTGSNDHGLIHTAAARNVTYLLKPPEQRSVDAFLDTVAEAERQDQAPIQGRRILHALIRGANLSPQQLEILIIRLSSDTPREAAERLSITQSALRSHIGEILRRTTMPNLTSLAAAILRGTLGADESAPGSDQPAEPDA